ncbi:MAG: D-alanyl-D-alanine carboxypeptidase family protein [Patescibacteria group bacterium]
MKNKLFWLISGVLILVLIGQFIYILKDKITLRKKPQVSGVEIFQGEKIALVSPPKKTFGTLSPQIAAKSAILIDKESFYILFSQNENLKIPIASTTKIMTALVVLEDYRDNLNDEVTITLSMIQVDGSDIQLRAGEKITVENLLKGLLIMSGNDTAYALAYHFGGKDNFVTKMNQKARYLGLENTQFQDPAGLDENGFSTAKDLAVLGAYAMRNLKFREIVKTSQTEIYSTDGLISHPLQTSNRMLRPDENLYYPLAIGIKTGFTNEAGHCLVAAAQKDSHEIISVILNTSENSITASAEESKKLLEWGFNNWTW